MIRVDFEIQTEYGLFKDSITYMEEENLSEQQIENIKQQRLNKWLQYFKRNIDTPPTEIHNPLQGNQE